MTIEQAQDAVSKGQTVHWKTSAYSLKTHAKGGWWVVCLNGHVAPLHGHKAEDFYLATPTQTEKAG